MNLMRQGGPNNQVLNNLGQAMAKQVAPARTSQNPLNILGQAMGRASGQPMRNTATTGSGIVGQPQVLNNLGQAMSRSGVNQRPSNGQNRQLVNQQNPVLQNLGNAMASNVRQSNVVPVQTRASDQNRVIGNLASSMNPNARQGAQSVILNNQPNGGGLNQGMKYSTYV